MMIACCRVKILRVFVDVFRRRFLALRGACCLCAVFVFLDGPNGYFLMRMASGFMNRCGLQPGFRTHISLFVPS